MLTGPTAGLGKALHDLLLESGFPLVAIGRNTGVQSQTLTERPTLRRYLERDFSRPVDKKFEACLVDAITAIDDQNLVGSLILINNAGTIRPIMPALEIVAEDMAESLNVNLHWPLAIATTLTRRAKVRGLQAVVINISTGAATRPIAGWLPYCVTKSACKMALDVLAFENSELKLIHFDPGVMDTGMQKHIREQSSDVMPDVVRFQAFSSHGELKSASIVASELLDIISGSLG